MADNGNESDIAVFEREVVDSVHDVGKITIVAVKFNRLALRDSDDGRAVIERTVLVGQGHLFRFAIVDNLAEIIREDVIVGIDRDHDRVGGGRVRIEVLVREGTFVNHASQIEVSDRDRFAREHIETGVGAEETVELILQSGAHRRIHIEQQRNVVGIDKLAVDIHRKAHAFVRSGLVGSQIFRRAVDREGVVEIDRRIDADNLIVLIDFGSVGDVLIAGNDERRFPVRTRKNFRTQIGNVAHARIDFELILDVTRGVVADDLDIIDARIDALKADRLLIRHFHVAFRHKGVTARRGRIILIEIEVKVRVVDVRSGRIVIQIDEIRSRAGLGHFKAIPVGFVDHVAVLTQDKIGEFGRSVKDSEICGRILGRRDR